MAIRPKLTRPSISALIALACWTNPLLAYPADRTDSGLGNARFNQYRVIGTHNAYHLEPDPAVKIWLQRARGGAFRGLLHDITYTHLPLETQLELGVRQFEIDLYNDPDGGRFSKPGLAELIAQSGQSLEAPVDPNGELARPGLKVLHVPDVDWRTTCRTFSSCLTELKRWSDDHPNHFPIMIVLDLKNESPKIDFDGRHADIIPFGPAEIRSVEAEISAILTSKDVYTPDQLRDGHQSVRERILKEGWPYLRDLRGKFLFILSNRALVDNYRGENINLRGRLMFADLEPGDPAAAFVERLDPKDPTIVELQKQGYMVQTFADFRTTASRSDDLSGLDAALGSGAASIATDYIIEDRRFSSYEVNFRKKNEYVILK